MKTRKTNLSQAIVPVLIGVAGYFQIEKCKADANGNAIESTRTIAAPWQKNLIVNQGLDLFLTTGVQLHSYCRVGSGSATPAFTDTALQSQLASSVTYQATAFGTQNSTPPYYGWTSPSRRAA